MHNGIIIALEQDLCGQSTENDIDLKPKIYICPTEVLCLVDRKVINFIVL